MELKPIQIIYKSIDNCTISVFETHSHWLRIDSKVHTNSMDMIFI